MFRTSMFIAAMLLASATAFAGDTPDLSSTGEAALPSGSKETAPSETATDKVPDVATSKSGDKGKPPVAPEK